MIDNKLQHLFDLWRLKGNWQFKPVSSDRILADFYHKFMRFGFGQVGLQ